MNDLYSAALIENSDHCFLIVRLGTGDSPPELESHLWCFPHGKAHRGESAEATIRRVAKEQLSLTVDVVIGQPPVRAQVDGKEAEFRFFLCAIVAGEATPGPYAELRWVNRAQLCEYDFDAASKPVADWLSQS